MKALQIPDLQNIQVVDLPMPEVKAGEVLLKLKYVGFCGSDLNTFLGRNAMAKANVIPGHEIGAVIEAVGEGVSRYLAGRTGSHRQSVYQLWTLCLMPQWPCQCLQEQ